VAELRRAVTGVLEAARAPERDFTVSRFASVDVLAALPVRTPLSRSNPPG
jgi:hypothetical protein